MADFLMDNIGITSHRWRRMRSTKQSTIWSSRLVLIHRLSVMEGFPRVSAHPSTSACAMEFPIQGSYRFFFFFFPGYYFTCALLFGYQPPHHWHAFFLYSERRYYKYRRDGIPQCKLSRIPSNLCLRKASWFLSICCLG